MSNFDPYGPEPPSDSVRTPATREERAGAALQEVQSLQQQVLRLRATYTQMALSGSAFAVNTVAYRRLLKQYEEAAKAKHEEFPDHPMLKSCLEQAVALRELNEF